MFGYQRDVYANVVALAQVLHCVTCPWCRHHERGTRGGSFVECTQDAFVRCVEGPEIVATQYDELGVVRVTKRFVQRVANVRIHAVTLLAVFPQSARVLLCVE